MLVKDTQHRQDVADQDVGVRPANGQNDSCVFFLGTPPRSGELFKIYSIVGNNHARLGCRIQGELRRSTQCDRWQERSGSPDRVPSISQPAARLRLHLDRHAGGPLQCSLDLTGRRIKALTCQLLRNSIGGDVSVNLLAMGQVIVKGRKDLSSLQVRQMKGNLFRSHPLIPQFGNCSHRRRRPCYHRLSLMNSRIRHDFSIEHNCTRRHLVISLLTTPHVPSTMLTIPEQIGAVKLAAAARSSQVPANRTPDESPPRPPMPGSPEGRPARSSCCGRERGQAIDSPGS